VHSIFKFRKSKQRAYFSRSHKHSTKSVEYCSTWKHSRRFWGAHTNRKKTLL